VLWIKTRRTKTDISVNVPLLPPAVSILDKYKDNTFRNNKILPVLSNQKMNSYLMEIADMCCIDKRLTTSLARHSFATTVTLANGMSMESVSKMLGHTNLVTTKIYARMLDSRVLNEMQALQQILETKKK
jgi:site-specific recombinase XerD